MENHKFKIGDIVKINTDFINDAGESVLEQYESLHPSRIELLSKPWRIDEIDDATFFELIQIKIVSIDNSVILSANMPEGRIGELLIPMISYAPDSTLYCSCTNPPVKDMITLGKSYKVCTTCKKEIMQK